MPPAKTKKTSSVTSDTLKPKKSVVSATTKNSSTTPSATKNSNDTSATTKKVNATTRKHSSKQPKPKNKAAAVQHVLFVGSECTPFAGTGGLGEVLGSLPPSINAIPNTPYQASVIMPLYQSVTQDVRASMQCVTNITVQLSWRKQYCGLFKYIVGNTTYYFIDNEYYFKRPNLYGYYDDNERFSFFCKCVLEVLPYLDHMPNILHCNDWHTALVPIYYKLFFMHTKEYQNIRNLFTIHNIEYQGVFACETLEEVLGIPLSHYNSLEFNGCINLVKGALYYADNLSTVSPTYAKELQDAFYAHGLQDAVKHNAHKMLGILNGIDTHVYNPQTNPALFKHYCLQTFADKQQNKLGLQALLNLPVQQDIPMVGIISRLVGHKGLDLVCLAMDELLKLNIQWVILGKGEPEFEEYFTQVAASHPNKVSCIIDYDKDLSHKIYAASDLFLMSSKSEPCGLSQMMACRYGCVPIVRATGGLADSILHCGNGAEVGNGFVFSEYDAVSMMHTINKAVALYTDHREAFNQLACRCMQSDFSWDKSAKEYVAFYNI